MNEKTGSAARGGHDEIAVIGLGCWYPGARNTAQLWENILGRRRQFRRMPDVRLPLLQYHDLDRSAPDKTYGTRAALLDGYSFDWARMRIPKQTYESTDIAHWLALDVVLQMLEDTGYTAAELPRETTQVIVGNTLTGEFTRANTLRGRWPFVDKMLSASAADLQLPGETIAALRGVMERNYKSVFPATNEDTLAGGLANTIAGRICNFLNLNGGGYVVDGACSSSLIAIHAAATSLAQHQADFVIAGGVDISLDPFELVGFAKTGALTPGDMAVYDKRGNGFIPGEGCGFVALKRLADAQRDGDKVYAVLDGWGMSSDGKGGITAPSAVGQSVALQRAYQRAGIDPAELDFIEGHGTGTTVGDKTELLGIARALGGGALGSDAIAARRRCGVTSFKSIVGHTKAAAGIGAFIKTALAVNQRVVPPTAGCELPHEAFSNEAQALYPVLRGEVLPPQASLRAGVSAMGFGGINVHVTMRSGAQALPGFRPAIGERAALVSPQDSELYTAAADNALELIAALRRLRAHAEGASLAELADLASTWNPQVPAGAPLRASLVARTPEELCGRIDSLLARLAQPLPLGEVWADASGGVALGHRDAPARLGFLLPGQGSQRLGMARLLVERFPWAAELVARADAWAAEAGTPGLADSIYADLDRRITREELAPARQKLQRTELAQPAIVLCSLLWLKYLEQLGLDASVVTGHSLGELTAFHAAGAFDEKTLIQLATLRGQLMAGPSGDADAAGAEAGAMVSLACDQARAQALLDRLPEPGRLVVANLNTASQTVVSGAADAARALLALAQQEGVQAQGLPVSHAFHSPMVAPAAAALRERAQLPAPSTPLAMPLISSCDGALVEPDLDLREHFASQITRPVDFIATARRLRSLCELALEVGPAAVLSNMVSPAASGAAPFALPVERQAESFHDLNWLLAVAHAHGWTPRWPALYAQRILRPFVPAQALQFIVNPCERPFDRQLNLGEAAPLAAAGHALALPPATAQGTAADPEFTHALASYLAQRGDFIAEVIKADLRTVARLVPPVPLSGAPASSRPAAAALTAAAPPPVPATPAASRAAAPTASSSVELVVGLAAAATGFPPEQITPAMSLLDDLNLDSIKAAALIAEACSAAGLAEPVDAGEAAGATLGQLAAMIDARRPAAAAPTAGARVAALPLVMGLAAKYTGFPAESLQPSLSFVDDLNLDSIKFAALVSEASAALGLQDPLSPADVAVTTLAGLAARLDAAAAPAQAAASHAPLAAPAQPDAGPPDWVRSFEMALHPAPLPETAAAPSLQGRVVALQHDEADAEAAAVLRSRFEAQGATVLTFDAERLLSQTRRDIAHFVVLLRREAAGNTARGDLIPDAVRGLRAAAIVSARQAASESLSYLQFASLGLGTPPGATGGLQTGAASSFAASVHLERPTLRVRVLDFDLALPHEAVAAQALLELAQPEPYLLRHFDAEGHRHGVQGRPVEPALQPAREIAWSDEDVVLVTGGAKGITAECALAFARETRARMVLVGSSRFDGEPESEIARTLARFSAEGLSACYLACNLAEGGAVAALVDTVAAEFGPITGVVHGAGINKPRRVEQCSEEDALKEIAPKLAGIGHLLEALAQRPPKLVAALSSIIGVTGMPGNAWYAFSNEALNLSLQAFGAAHPETQAVSLAYSVWAEVGMGAKMGSTQHLSRMGISSVAPALGVEHFMHWVSRRSPAAQMVVASRLGGLDTWVSAQPPVAAADEGRFIDELRLYEPGVELVSRTRLTLDDDLYLRDHHYRGVYLFPTVFGLEAMAQAVVKVLGLPGLQSLRLEDIQLRRPIVVAGDGGALIEITAQVQPRRDAGDAQRVQVGLRTQHTGFRIDHFSACFVLEPQAPRQLGERLATPEAAIDIEPLTELYGGLLFQGPLFQRMRKVWRMAYGGALIDLEWRATDRYFAPRKSARLVLGDPAMRDVLLQSPQLSEKGTYLPVFIRSWRMLSLDGPARAADADRGLVRAVSDVRPSTTDERDCDVHAAAEDGTLLESLEGYLLKRMELPDNAAAPDDIVNPQVRDAGLLQRALAQACAAFRLREPSHVLCFNPALPRMNRSQRRLGELPMFSQAVLRAVDGQHEIDPEQLEIHWNDDGKPVLRGPAAGGVQVSLSHDRSHCLCVAGDGPQGCDIEPIVARGEEQWLALLGTRHRPLLNRLVAGGDSLDHAGTRLWCALEATQKALGMEDTTLVLRQREGDSVLFDGSGRGGAVSVLTLVLTFTRQPRKAVALVVAPLPVALPEPAGAAAPASPPPLAADSRLLPAYFQGYADTLATDYLALGPQGQPKPCFRFRTTFKDTTTLRHSLDYPVFAAWMGNVRELSIMKLARELVPDFASGRWGMVTNESHIDVRDDAHCLDMIEGRMYISRAYGSLGSSIDMHFEWLTVLPDGSLRPIATSTMATTWVEIKGHGIVEVQPFPAYLQEFVRAALPADAAAPAIPDASFALQAGAHWAGSGVLGEALYEAPHAPKVEPELLRQVFSTTSAESNLVGNIYFANYYHWQKRVIDRFLHAAAPALFTAEGRQGEFHWRHCEVRHLREAMPFDQIEVVMALKSLHERGLRLHFDYYRLGSGGERVKLAWGECEAAWVGRDAALASAVPELYRRALLAPLAASSLAAV